MAGPWVSIIIVTINRKKDLAECIESLRKVTYPHRDVTVVDNGSTDGTAAYIREHFPEVRLIEPGENLGFARGNNLATRMAFEEGRDYVLLLNDDVVVDPGFLEPMVELAESDPKIGGVGPKVYYHSIPDVLWATGDQEGIGKRDDGSFDSVREISWVIGCAFLLKRAVADRIGLMDEDFFLYAEEDEYCHRISKGGFTMYYAPAAKIWHKTAPGDVNLKSYQVYYNCRNSILVRRKKFKGVRLCLSICNYLVRGVPRYALALIRNGRAGNIRYLFSGAVDGLLWCVGLKRAGRNMRIPMV